MKINGLSLQSVLIEEQSHSSLIFGTLGTIVDITKDQSSTSSSISFISSTLNIDQLIMSNVSSQTYILNLDSW